MDIETKVCVWKETLQLGVCLSIFAYEQTGIVKANGYANMSARADLLAHLSISPNSVSAFYPLLPCLVSFVYAVKNWNKVSTVILCQETNVFLSFSSLSRELAIKLR